MNISQIFLGHIIKDQDTVLKQMKFLGWLTTELHKCQ